MKNLKKIACALFLGAVMFTACNEVEEKIQDPRVKQLSKAWEYDKVDLDGTVFPGEQMGSPRMIFQEDSSYTMSFQNMVDSGQWYFKGDTLVTTTYTNPGVEEYLTIQSLTTDEIVLKGYTNGKELLLTMRTVEE